MIPKWAHDQYGIDTVFDLNDHWELFKDPGDPSKGIFINCIDDWDYGILAARHKSRDAI